jgi:sugar lactone lactonase YvrE
MPEPAAQCLVDGLALGESPVWDEKEGVLWFVDIDARQVLCLQPESGTLRRFPMPAQPGSLGLTTDGRLVVALRSGVHLFHPGTGALTFLTHPEPGLSTNRMNDGKVGPDGHFWVGSMDERPEPAPIAALYRVTPAGEVSRVLTGLRISNGLAWSPDGRRLYHADSGAPLIQHFDFDPDAGIAENPRPLLQLEESHGVPDGAAMDAEGCYWSAGISADSLHRFAPDGRLLARMPLPITAPTMPCFGGADMRTLYVTSLRETRGGVERDGALIALRVEVPGLPGWRFGERARR